MGKRVAILATNGFEQSELMEPKRLLEEAGAQTMVISPESGEIKGWKDKNWGDTVPVDESLNEASESNYDALVLPGGQMNPDILRMNPKAVSLVRSFVEAGKPVGAICHGPWLLAEAGVLDGRQVTSWPSIKTDLTNAGAEWTDEEVVTDNGIVTSRKPDDIPAFARKMIEEINEGYHDRRHEDPRD